MSREIIYEHEMSPEEQAFDDFERLNHLGPYAEDDEEKESWTE